MIESRTEGHSRRARLAGVAVAIMTACLLALMGAYRSPHATPGPNVVMIVVDTLRPDHLSSYGYDRSTAVALDDFTAQATRFDEAYATASWTAPSVASLFTGLLPSRHHVQRFGTKLPDNVTTLAETLRAHGWYTVASSFNPNVSRQWGFGQGFEDFDDLLGNPLDYPDISTMVDRALTWLDAGPPKPFFLYLQPMNAHGPYRVPPAEQSKLLGHAPTREFVYYGPLMSAVVTHGQIALRREITQSYINSLVDQYDTAIRYTMDQLGRLLARLRADGLYDDALIIVTSDHGEELFDHGGFSHGYSLHGELLHVPLFVKLPHQTRALSVSQRVSLIDLYPSLLELLDIALPHAVDGVSFVSLLRGQDASHAPQAAERALFHEIDWPERCVSRSILAGSYKLIERVHNYEGRGPETLLYDVEHDPQERTDLAAREPAIVGRLLEQLAERVALVPAQTIGRPASGLREEDRKRLEALGYF